MTVAGMPQVVNFSFPAIENPLSNGGNFGLISGLLSEGNLQVVAAGICEATELFGDQCISFWIGQVPVVGTWPSDHAAQITIKSFSGAQNFLLYVRQTWDVNGFKFRITASTGVWTISTFSAGTVASGISTFAVNDVWTLVAQGSTISLLRNGGLITSFTDTSGTTGGMPGFGIGVSSSLSNARISNFSAFAAVSPITPNKKWSASDGRDLLQIWGTGAQSNDFLLLGGINSQGNRYGNMSVSAPQATNVGTPESQLIWISFDQRDLLQIWGTGVPNATTNPYGVNQNQTGTVLLGGIDCTGAPYGNLAYGKQISIAPPATSVPGESVFRWNAQEGQDILQIFGSSPAQLAADLILLGGINCFGAGYGSLIS